MKLFKQFYKYFIILFSLILFIVLRIAFGSNIFIYILTALIGVALYYGISFYFDYKQKELESSYEYQSKNMSEKNESELSQIVEKLQEMGENKSGFRNVILEFLSKVDSFVQKEKALNELIQMNDDKAKRFLQERSQATNSFIIANAKKLIKAMIAYDAQSKKNRPARIEDVEIVQDVLKSMDSLTTNYDQLLEEVAKMGDDFNPEDPGLRDVVENLQEIRKTSNVDDSDNEPEEIHLFVNGASS
ncbi:MAG: hypothetical protein IKI57_07020 [Clostridia bacterium]|nr:hypothetical protein [Clostridia bacterium]